MDKYSTHLPVFEKLFGHKKYSKVLEFGLGFSSTPFLLKNCDNLTSIEMQSEEWYKKVNRELKDELNWRSYLALGPFEFEQIEVINESYDLIFVDGHLSSRPEIINRYFNKCDTIVTHDFEASIYRWNLIEIPFDYSKFVYTKLNPHTAIFTKDDGTKEMLLKCVKTFII